MTYATLPSRFLNAIRTLPNPAPRWSAGRPLAGHLFTRILRRVAGLSTLCVELGRQAGDPRRSFFRNRPECTPPISPSNGAGAFTGAGLLHEISRPYGLHPETLRRPRSSSLLARLQLQKILAVRTSLPDLEQIIVADGGPNVPANVSVTKLSLPRGRGGHFLLPTCVLRQVLPGSSLLSFIPPALRRA